MELIIIGIYGLCLFFILLYSFVQLHLATIYLKKGKQQRQVDSLQNFPPVTIQLPLYNEKFVVERLIDAVAAIDYPSDKLEIQVLDDSTDETSELVARKIKAYPELNIRHIQRENRTGFKAGALAYGLNQCKGEFIAIFDADFLPKKDFLKNTVPHFNHERIGVVQTRWEHINKDYSLLTQLQAFGLDAHFSVEQVGRNESGCFINFNGTAGVWRKSCIHDAGGWQSDTLTEDLDLSYRAQLKGWNFIFLEEVGAPAELPVFVNALKGQQFRWTKGAAQCFRKNIGKVLRAPNLPVRTKIHAFFHLLNSSVFIAVLLLSLLSLPMVVIQEMLPEYNVLFNLSGVFMISFFILAFFYWVASCRNHIHNISVWRYFKQFPLFLSISMGLALHNAIAVAEGLLGKKSPFVRTPKYNIQPKTDLSFNLGAYFVSKHPLTYVELLFAVYFCFALYYDITHAQYGFIPFHLMLAFGYLFIVLGAFRNK